VLTSIRSAVRNDWEMRAYVAPALDRSLASDRNHIALRPDRREAAHLTRVSDYRPRSITTAWMPNRSATPTSAGRSAPAGPGHQSLMALLDARGKDGSAVPASFRRSARQHLRIWASRPSGSLVRRWSICHTGGVTLAEVKHALNWLGWETESFQRRRNRWSLKLKGGGNWIVVIAESRREAWTRAYCLATKHEGARGNQTRFAQSGLASRVHLARVEEPHCVVQQRDCGGGFPGPPS